MRLPSTRMLLRCHMLPDARSMPDDAHRDRRGTGKGHLHERRAQGHMNRSQRRAEVARFRRKVTKVLRRLMPNGDFEDAP
jgi:hypothetical protein